MLEAVRGRQGPRPPAQPPPAARPARQAWPPRAPGSVHPRGRLRALLGRRLLSGAPLNLAQTPPNRHFEQYGRKRKNERRKPLCRRKCYEKLSKFSWLLVKVAEAVYSKSRIMFATVRHNYLQTCLSPAPS
ncbi:unnamed protein product [Rangifer tarandus platyrhynchus]|uniref:Uncharacterized protein n=1 Tax=Rangifer tarandus platyrhynchus TaxID=3082113 RepID=A0ABN8YFW7_RANTA|nr:unnamed protein product [Rangifer tarandus platyrhynchus]